MFLHTLSQLYLEVCDPALTLPSVTVRVGGG